jgi:DNA-binding transcriptional MerR regulator
MTTQQFRIEELQTLVARALQSGDYHPADSARIRAVPDTRTIRYYTTLGLLSPPAEMRGRTAYYGKLHALQLIAIKRLQAENLTLSDIQQRLAGLTGKRLEGIAKLPDDFWEAAHQYLVNRDSRESVPDEGTNHTAGEQEDFWLTPAALPSVPESAPIDNRQRVAARAAIRLQLAGDVTLTIELPADRQSNISQVDAKSLLASAQPIVKELARQGLLAR